MAITLSWSAMPVPGEINFESKARSVFTETKSNGEALTLAVYNLEETAIAAATGIKYVWPTSTERAAESGMSTNDLGLQQDTRQIYRYTGSAWETWYLLDPQALDTTAVPEFAGASIGHGSPLKPLHAKTNNSSYLEITSTATNSRSSTLDLIHTTSADMVDGFGVQLNFRATDATASLKLLGRIAAIRDGADTEGALAFYAGTNGAEEFGRFSSDGHLLLNTTTAGDWASGWNVLRFASEGSIMYRDTQGIFFSKSAYHDGVWKYQNTDEAQLISFDSNGKISFRVAPSGTADTGITWTTALTIVNDGGISMGALPTSASGLSTGDLWNNSGVVNIV